MKLAFVILSVLVGLCVAFAPPNQVGVVALRPLARATAGVFAGLCSVALRGANPPTSASISTPSAPPKQPRLIGQALRVPPGCPIAAFQYAPDVQGPWRTAFVLTNGPRPVVLFDVSDQRQMFYRFLPGPPVPPFPE